MKSKFQLALIFATAFLASFPGLMRAQSAIPPRPQGPCDIYAAAGDACIAAHSTTRALYASYNGPLYQVKRQSDGKTLNIGVVQPSASPYPDPGGYANAAAQDAFCRNTDCWLTRIYDQSGHHNDLTQAPRGGFSGPAMGGFNNLPLAGMAPVMVLGHQVYGVYIEPGMGLRDDDPRGTAVDDQAEGIYWIIDGHHYNSGCCFDYGNAEIDSRDDDNGTMETAYFGNAPWWFHGTTRGPWIMTDQENNLVGCVNPDGSKSCYLPHIGWRFVTAIAEGKPHHWRSMGGNAQQGRLAVMFSGPRVNASYDPMRKQGAIVLGNGGDNSNGSQGTFYEGAMTAAGTYPSSSTEQLVQANIAAAGYEQLPLKLAPAAKAATALLTFPLDSTRNIVASFTNTTRAPLTNLRLSLAVPHGWTAAAISGSEGNSRQFVHPLAPGQSVSAAFKITSGNAGFDGDLLGRAQWRDAAQGRKHSLTLPQKVRCASPVKIRTFRVSSGPPMDSTDSFIELYNAGRRSVDISNWTLTLRPTEQAIFSAVKIPAGTKLAAGGSYRLGLSDSGLASAARPGDRIIYTRNTFGMSAGDTIAIGAGSNLETRKIVSVGTPAGIPTTLWQPLPDGPVITIPAGSTNLPVTSVAGFKPGEKIALGYGATYPTVPERLEHFEVATITAVGQPGTQAYLAADAPAGSTHIQVTSVRNISPGDRIRLDIDSLGHGIETVTVKRVGTRTSRTFLMAAAEAGATHIAIRDPRGFQVGDKITLGARADAATVKITALGAWRRTGAIVDFTPALTHAFHRYARAVDPGTGLELAAPLRYSHSANLPFSDRGTGLSFQPATAFAHISNEPIEALGAGITLNRPLDHAHAINAVVRDAAVTSAGYLGKHAPNQWFGGPALASEVPLFGRIISLRAGSMVLRDASGLVVDSLNYGGHIDPWAAAGYRKLTVGSYK